MAELAYKCSALSLSLWADKEEEQEEEGGGCGVAWGRATRAGRKECFSSSPLPLPALDHSEREEEGRKASLPPLHLCDSAVAMAAIVTFSSSLLLLSL